MAFCSYCDNSCQLPQRPSSCLQANYLLPGIWLDASAAFGSKLMQCVFKAMSMPLPVRVLGSIGMLSFLVTFLSPTQSLAQANGQSMSIGSNSVVSYTSSTTYNLSTTQNSSGDYNVVTDAFMGIKEGSQIVKASGSIGGGTSAALTSSSLSVSGISSSGALAIDENTTLFGVSISPNPEYAGPPLSSLTSGSAFANITTDVKATSLNSFESTFVQAY